MALPESFHAGATFPVSRRTTKLTKNERFDLFLHGTTFGRVGGWFLVLTGVTGSNNYPADVERKSVACSD